MADAISRSAWVGSVQGSATHHRPRGSPAGALDPTRGAALPATRGPSRERALAPSPRRIASVGGPSPWTSDGRGLPARAVRTLDPGRTCSRERPAPGAIKRSRARPSAARREAATRGQRAGRRRSPRRATDGATRPLFADGRPGVGLSSCTRRCHRAARSRASRADSSPRASRRSACAATASASAAMAANSSSRFNAPAPPIADYPTPDASNPRRPGRAPGSSTGDSGGRRPAITRGDARTHSRDSLHRHESGQWRGPAPESAF